MDHRIYDECRERLLEAPYWVVDFLPRQVPPESGGHYFAVERYLMAHPQIDELYGRFARLLVKLSCYYDMAVYDPRQDIWCDEITPEELVGWVEACAGSGRDRYLHVLFPAEDALFTLDGDDLYMTLYNPGGELLDTATQLAAAEGLFVRTTPSDER